MSNLPTVTALPGYFDNFDARNAKGYQSILFRTGTVLQSAELMAMQQNLLEQIREVADGLYDNGDIIEGLSPVMLVGNPSGNLRVDSGKIYLRGRVYTVGTSTMTIPVDVKVSVGVRLYLTVVTDQQDPILKDIAVAYDNYQEPGAATVKAEIKWGWVADGGVMDEVDPLGEFYPVYSIDKGNIILKNIPPAVSTIIDALAGYDYTAHGNYNVDGFKVRFARFEAALAGVRPDQYVFTVSNGTVHVRGYPVSRTVDTPLEVAIDYDLANSENESETYVPVSGVYSMTLNRTPLGTITAINGLVEIIEAAVVKGAPGTADTLTSSSVEYVIEVKQGVTIYTSPADYTLVDGTINWAPGGAEPTGTYSVKYAARENLLTNGRGNIVSQSNTAVVLTGLVPHTTPTPSYVYISYSYKLSRVDAITIDKEGDFHRLKGRPSLYNPSAPSIPSTHTKLALIIYDWFNDPVVRDIRTPAASFDELVKLENRVSDLYDLIAQERLRSDLSAREPADRRGQFVDPFLDNDFRDPDLSNSMAIVSGLLTLPITAEADPPNYFENSLRHHLLPYTHEVVIDQPRRTACSKINPYQAFEPIPARVTISPTTDTWVVPAGSWNSPIASNFVRVVTDKTQKASPALNNLDVPNSQVAQVVRLGDTIRPQLISFRIDGFGPGEALVRILFDGIVYSNTIAGCLPFTTTAPTADASGSIWGSFTLPAGIPTGEKAVEFFGASSYGDAAFIGMAFISLPTMVRNSTRSGRRRKRKRCDPLAETFTLDDDRILTGVDLKFCKVGALSRMVYVQIRETTVGLPNQEIIGEGLFDVSDLTLDVNGIPINAWSRVLFDIPVHVIGGKEYAIVILTDDANHSIATAAIGSYMMPALNDGVAGFITAQPYQSGEMLSSSNAVTWTPHPKEDLTFRLLAAKFSAGSSVISLGTFDAINVSDLLTRATVLRPSADCDVLFRYTPSLSSGTYEAREDTPLALPLRLTGEVLVEAILTANNVTNPNLSPILYPRPQVVKGNMSDTGNYISRGLNGRDLVGLTNDFRATVVFEYQKKAGTTLAVKMQSHVLSVGVPVYASGVAVTEWKDLDLYLEKALGDGWYEAEYRLPADAVAVAPSYNTRIQVLATGAPNARVFVRNLRGTTKA